MLYPTFLKPHKRMYRTRRTFPNISCSRSVASDTSFFTDKNLKSNVDKYVKEAGFTKNEIENSELGYGFLRIYNKYYKINNVQKYRKELREIINGSFVKKILNTNYNCFKD